MKTSILKKMTIATIIMLSFVDAMAQRSTEGIKIENLSKEDYTITETVDANYVQSFTGDCDVVGNLVLNANDTKNCTLTNTYVGG